MGKLLILGLLMVVSGCVTAQQGMWQRLDGTRIEGNAPLAQKKQVDIAACSAEVSKVIVLSSATSERRDYASMEIMTGCMMQRGYHLVRG